MFDSSVQSTGYNIVVLLGIGGQGKTQIALEYCQSMRHKYEYILWADAEDINTLRQSFKQFARRLVRHPSDTKLAELGTDALDDPSNLDIVKEALNDSHFLLVLDNLDNPGALQNVRGFFPISDHGHIIISSRHRDTARLGTRLSVDGMILDDAIKLLNIRSEKEDESREDAIRVVETLGRLPLAIDQAAAYIRFINCSFPKFVRDFCERKDILLDSQLPIFWEYKRKQKSNQDNTEIDQKLGVWTTWQLSLDLLKTGNNGASWVHLLTLSAILNGRNISQAFLHPWLKNTRDNPDTRDRFEIFPWLGPTATTQHVGQAMSNSIEDRFRQFVADAYNLSLIQTRTDGTRGICYSIHPLVIEWLQRRLHEDERRSYIYEGFSVVETCLYLIEDSDDTFAHEVTGHCRACLQNNAKLNERDEKLGTGRHRDAGVQICGWLHYDFNSTETEYESILRAALDSTPPYGDDYFKILNRVPLFLLGLLHLNKKELKDAIFYFEQVLSSPNCFYGDFISMKSLPALCNAYLVQENPEKAHSCAINFFKDWLKYIGDQDGDLWKWIELLGSTYTPYIHKNCPDFAIELYKALIPSINDRLLVNTEYTQSVLYNSVSYQSGRVLLLCQRDDQARQTFVETLRKLPDISRGDEEFWLILQCLCHLSLLSNGSAKTGEDDYQNKIAEFLGSGLSFKGRPAAETIHSTGIFSMILFFQNIDKTPFESRLTSMMSFEEGATGNISNNVEVLCENLKMAMMSGQPSGRQYVDLQNAVSIREALYGPADVQVTGAKFMVATYSFGDGLSEDALRIWQELLEVYTSIESAEVTITSRCIGRCFLRLNRDEDFRTLKERFIEIDWPHLENEEAAYAENLSHQEREEATFTEVDLPQLKSEAAVSTPSGNIVFQPDTMTTGKRFRARGIRDYMRRFR